MNLLVSYLSFALASASQSGFGERLDTQTYRTNEGKRQLVLASKAQPDSKQQGPTSAQQFPNQMNTAVPPSGNDQLTQNAVCLCLAISPPPRTPPVPFLLSHSCSQLNLCSTAALQLLQVQCD